MFSNYHAHSKWCRHGEGDVEDIILKAIDSGYTEFAISEHVPYPIDLGGRILLSELDDFIRELDFVKDKYKNKISILKGLECEYFEEYHDHYTFLQNKYNLDFLCLGQHFEKINMKKNFFLVSNNEDILSYEKHLIKGMKSGLFSFVAHPDLYLNSINFNEQAKKTAKNILRTAEELNIPLEINANGIRYKRGYPSKEFWKESLNFNITTLINSDSHFLNEIYDNNIKKAYEEAKKLNINITEKLNLKK